MAGIVAIVSGIVAVVALVLLFVVGYRAVMAIPTATEMRPELNPKRIRNGFFLSVICAVATVVFLISGVVWIVERFTT